MKFCEKLKSLSKNEILWKIEKFVKKLKVSSKIELFVKNSNFRQKIQIFVTNWTFRPKFTCFLGLSGSGGEDIPIPIPSSPSPLKLARRRRRLLIPSPQENHEKNCGFQPDTESSPPSSPLSSRRMRQLTLFDSPRTPRAIARRMSDRQMESPRWRTKKVDSPRSNGTPKIDPGVTINPFTPANRSSGKRSRVSIRAAATSR